MRVVTRTVRALLFLGTLPALLPLLPLLGLALLLAADEAARIRPHAPAARSAPWPHRTLPYAA